jgi:tetratricopeptide (TPR) repeat protein
VRVQHVGYVDPNLRARKLQRDLKLLQQQLSEYPDDPFCLFNLGAVFQERRDWPQAIACLGRSLELSHPRDSIVRKLYAMISQCHLAIPDQPAALQTLEQARVLYPQDAELLFLEAGLRRELGEPALAETLYRELIHGQDAPHFASVDSGLRTHKAHHNLGLVLLDPKATTQAREQFDEALRHQPEFLPKLVGTRRGTSPAGKSCSHRSHLPPGSGNRTQRQLCQGTARTTVASLRPLDRRCLGLLRRKRSSRARLMSRRCR